MAGPCLTTYTKNIISESEKADIWNYVRVISSHMDGDSFWIAGQPFILSFGDEFYEEDQQLDLGGWNPKDCLVFSAMCNNQVSHVFLAMLSMKVIEITEGKILLESITSFTSNKTVLTMSGHVKLNDTDYAVNSEFMNYWVGESEFRLLK